MQDNSTGQASYIRFFENTTGNGVVNNGGQIQTFNLGDNSNIEFLEKTSADGGTTPGYIVYNLNSASSWLGFYQNENLTFSSTINGAGNILISCPNVTQTFTSANNHTGSIYINAGTLALSGSGALASSKIYLVNPGPGTFDISGITASTTTIKKLVGFAGSIVNLGSKNLTIDQNDPSTFEGIITGTGGITKSGTGNLSLNEINTYIGTTTISDGYLSLEENGSIAQSSNVIVNGTLIISDITADSTTIKNLSGSGSVYLSSKGINVNSTSDTVFSGSINDGSLGGSLTKSGSNKLTLSAVNTYLGATTIFAGTLDLSGNGSIAGSSSVSNSGTLNIENLSSADTSIQNYNGAGNVVFGSKGLYIYQNSDGVMSGTLTSNANGFIDKFGQAKLSIPNTATASGFFGGIAVDEGELNLNATLGGVVQVFGGTLTGTGTIVQGLLAYGGTVKPGNSIGTLTVFGNYLQGTGSEYYVQLDPNSVIASLLNIGGTATIENGTLITLVSTSGNAFSLTNTYEIMRTAGGITGNFTSYTISNTNFTPIFNYTANNLYVSFISSLRNNAKTSNEINAANALDSLANPNAAQTAFLNNFLSLSPEATQRGLQEVAGEPYGNMMLGVQQLNVNLFNTVFEPLRPYIAKPCGLKDVCSDTWFEVSGVRSKYSYDSNHASSMEGRGFNVACGMHSRVENNTLVGAGLFYENDYYNYYREGSSRHYSLLGTLYGLYRSKSYYVLVNGMGGYSFGKMDRHAYVGNLGYSNQSRPGVGQAGFYGECGKDFLIQQILVQPFVRFNANYYSWQSLNESGDGITSLNAPDHSNVAGYGRLGFHLTTMPEPSGLLLGLDANWAYRITKRDNKRYVAFNQFPGDYIVEGVALAPNSLETSLYASQDFNDQWKAYLEAYAQVWKRAVNGSLTLGFSYRW